MIIRERVFKDLMKFLPDNPPEIGGLLGGKNYVINTIEFDDGLPGQMCGYTPNVKRLNAVIEQWNQKNIHFMGMFHTHFFGVKTLSDFDKKYITRILDVMPEFITQLYFPIAVLPEKMLVPYIAIRKNPDVLIHEEKLFIMQEEKKDEEY